MRLLIESPSQLASFRKDHIGRLFCRHIHGTHDEESGDLREDRGIHDPKASGAPYLEVLIEDRHGIAIPAYGTGARGMVSPGLILHEIAKVVVRLDFIARQLFLSKNTVRTS